MLEVLHILLHSHLPETFSCDQGEAMYAVCMHVTIQVRCKLRGGGGGGQGAEMQELRQCLTQCSTVI